MNEKIINHDSEKSEMMRRAIFVNFHRTVEYFKRDSAIDAYAITLAIQDIFAHYIFPINSHDRETLEGFNHFMIRLRQNIQLKGTNDE